VDERAVDELRALERRDAELAAEGERLRALDADVGSLRGRAEEIEAFFLVYAEAEARLRAASDAAAAELGARREELAEAERAASAARDEDARAAAERALARARDHVASAEARVVRAAGEREAHEHAAGAATTELPKLTARATRLAVPEAGAPGDTPRELVDWAARAHATLFVAAGQIDAQRDRVVREANELATMLLGEPTYGATASQALGRVEASLA
jgi:hypothetical protein